MKEPSNIKQELITKKAESKHKRTKAALLESEQNYRLLATYHKRLNDISIAFTEASDTEDLFNRIAESFRLLTGAIAATFSIYDQEIRALKVVTLSTDPISRDKVDLIFGPGLFEMHMPVSQDDMTDMLKQGIRKPKDLFELSFGVIPQEISDAIMDAVGCRQIIALAISYAEELIGTCIAYLPADQPVAPDDALKTYIYLTGMAVKRRLAEEALRESEEKYRNLFENANEAILVAQGGKIVFSNSMLSIITGYNNDETIMRYFVDFLHPDDRDIVMNRHDNRMKDEDVSQRYSFRIISRDGSVKWVDLNTVRISWQGKPATLNFLADITDRRKVEETLRESEEKFRSVVERSLVGIAIIDDTFQYNYVNEEFCKMAGHKKQEILGKNFTFLLAEESKSLVAERNRRRQQGENVPPEYEFLFVQKNGLKLTGEVRSALYLDSSGKTKVLIQVIDITGRKRTEEVLRESEEKYRLIAENTADLIAVMDMNLCFTYISPSITRTHGYTVEEAMTMSLDQRLTPISMQNLLTVFDEEMKLEVTGNADSGRIRILELEEYKKNGSILWLETSVSAMRDKENKPIGLLTVSRDITLRKQADEALRKSEGKFRKLTEASIFGISITDGQRFLYGNPTVLKMSGYSEAEYLSKPMLDFVTPESRELIRQRAMDRLAGKTVPDHYEIQVLTKDGSIKWADVGAAVIDYNGKPATIFTLYDITDRKTAEAEKESLQAQLIRAQKMEALGQLAGGVAHDLNNVLGILSGYSELLLMEIPEGSRSRGHVEKILQSTEKGAAIIQDLLTLARRGVTASEVINLNSVVFDFLKTPVFENMKDYHPRVTFRIECDNNLLNIKGSPVHLEKTLMNLVSNAAESISGKGEVTIRTESRYLDKTIRGYDEVREGDYAVLTVSDNGMGIPAEHREKIFEPFYTKKAMGRSGTGLGLAIVWGTVKDLNGYIDMQTKVGEGTTFTLYFPVTREELIAPQQKVPIEQYMGNGESVLVVDDIAEQRDVASGLLTQLGYKVQEVSSGEEAVEYLKGNKADILILDMIMAPGIDGLETYRRVLEVNPQQKAILVSGFSETDRVREAQKLGAGAYVKKPYVMEKIGMAIRDELKR